MHSKPSSSANGQKISRKKELNVIYFVDSSTTKSFKLSLASARVILGGFIGLAVWSFGAAIYISTLSTEGTSLKRRISYLTATIFDYQTRYDGIYESAYPAGKESGPPAILTSQNTKPTPAAGTVKAEGTALAAKLVKEIPKQATKPVPETTTVDGGLNEIEIDEPYFSESEQTLNVDFAIKNTNNDNRASGFVWAVVKMKTTQGQDLYIAQPPDVDVDNTGSARQPMRATKFTIRKFKPVSVNFTRPANTLGTFQEVKIVIVDQNGKKQDFKYPIKHPILTKAVEKKAGETAPLSIDTDGAPKKNESTPVDVFKTDGIEDLEE